MTARAVIGANFGDEGKGLVVDYLCAREGAGVVVRHNGGAQAGHTVVTPEGLRHVFSHFSAGTFVGVPTYLSRFFVCNPLLWEHEREQLRMTPLVFADPDCMVTTFADMIANQRRENDRGRARHGSCGVGFNQTITRHQIVPLTMRTLWDYPNKVEPIVRRVCDMLLPGEDVDEAVDDFVCACELFANNVLPARIYDFREPIFEGAQGLMLDQDHRYFPHVTRSKTGLMNAMLLAEEGKFGDLHAYYVSRSYLTRHGAGPLPNEDPALRFHDSTNVYHLFQENLRFAPLDYAAMRGRVESDGRRAARTSLVLTHCDQLGVVYDADLYFYGETRKDVTSENPWPYKMR